MHPASRVERGSISSGGFALLLIRADGPSLGGRRERAARTNHVMMWTGDPGMYLKQGLHKNKSSTFPGGTSVIYFGPTRISYSKP
jgi:hypothetical protein